MIFFDGEEPRYEGDEYVEITNQGGEPQQMEGWTLTDADDGGPSFVFPFFVLEPNASVLVYTNRDLPGSFSFGSGTAIWNNSEPDRAELIDADGNVVSSSSY